MSRPKPLFRYTVDRAAAPNPSAEEVLLTEIRDLLAK